jgi:hypothetical protein
MELHPRGDGSHDEGKHTFSEDPILGVAEAKGKLSEVTRADQQTPKDGGAAFLQRVEALKQRHGDGVGDFEPPRLGFVPSEPFARKETDRN